ncbi:hypothetical protein ACFL2H_12940 [Planctomycetota bacterium]
MLKAKLVSSVVACVVTASTVVRSEERSPSFDELHQHIVTLHAETKPKGMERFFSAFSIATNGRESILVSSSWGAEPFSKSKKIDSLHVENTKEPVRIIAFDTNLGVAIFSIKRVVPPWPREKSVEVSVGDHVDEIVLKSRAYRPSRSKPCKVKTTESTFVHPDETNAQKVSGTFILKGRLAGTPGSLILKHGKLAGVFLQTAGIDFKDMDFHIVPTELLLERAQGLLARSKKKKET